MFNVFGGRVGKTTEHMGVTWKGKRAYDELQLIHEVVKLQRWGKFVWRQVLHFLFLYPTIFNCNSFWFLFAPLKLSSKNNVLGRNNIEGTLVPSWPPPTISPLAILPSQVTPMTEAHRIFSEKLKMTENLGVRVRKNVGRDFKELTVENM